jgi:hypothetical protein
MKSALTEGIHNEDELLRLPGHKKINEKKWGSVLNSD